MILQKLNFIYSGAALYRIIKYTYIGYRYIDIPPIGIIKLYYAV